MENRKIIINEIIDNFHIIGNRMHSCLIKLENSGHITHSQVFVLAIIEKNKNIGVKELAKKLNISSSATTQLVDGLVANGHVDREINLKDRRALQLKLSLKGQKYINNLNNKRFKIISTLFTSLNDKELKMYLKLHKKIIVKINSKF